MYADYRRALARKDSKRPMGTCEIKGCRYQDVTTSLVMDHCHIHGHIRGKICSGCNESMRTIDDAMAIISEGRFNSQVFRVLVSDIKLHGLPSSYIQHWNKCPDCSYSFTSEQILGILDKHWRESAYGRKVVREMRGSLRSAIRAFWRLRRMNNKTRKLMRRENRRGR